MAFFLSPRIAKLSLVVAVSFGSAACGDSSDSEGTSGSGNSLTRETALSFEGIYELTHYTENASGCDAEGASLLGTTADPWFVLVARTVLSTQTLELVSCADAADCGAKAEQIRNNGIYAIDYGATLSSEASADELGGFRADTGFQENGMCVERQYVDHVLTRSEDVVRLESRTKALDDKPAEDGFCVVRPSESRAEAETAPCAAFDVIEGTKTSDL
jgi:hypothetical protein